MTVREIQSSDAAFLDALRAADLPTSDLHEGGARYYALQGDSAFGGVAVYGDLALLRSVVVPVHRRGSGSGTALVHELIARATDSGIKEVWLLTTTAEHFFAGIGFAKVERSAAPAAIQAASQFKDLCPASATLMRKEIG